MELKEFRYSMITFISSRGILLCKGSSCDSSSVSMRFSRDGNNHRPSVQRKHFRTGPEPFLAQKHAQKYPLLSNDQ